MNTEFSPPPCAHRTPRCICLQQCSVAQGKLVLGSHGSGGISISGKGLPRKRQRHPRVGKFWVFTSRVDAFRSLSVEEQDDQWVWLLHVANNVQLKQMVLPGMEAFRPGKELYLRVKRSTERKPYRHSPSLLPSWHRGGFRYTRHRGGISTLGKNNPRSPFFVLPGLLVVHFRGFKVRDTSSDSSPTRVADQKRKRPFSRG